MGKKGAEYERELRKILSGDREIIERICRGCDEESSHNYHLLIQNPFLVVRAAGSFGVDLIAMRREVSFPIEVKVSSDKKIVFSRASGRAQKQYEEFRKLCERSGIMMLYAYRLKRAKGDPWKIFAMDVKPECGTMKLIYNFLPKMTTTERGNIILRWEEGKPLNEFIAYVLHLIK